MKKLDLDAFLEDHNIEITASFMEYRIYRNTKTERFGVINIKTSEIQHGAIFDLVMDIPRGGHFFLRHTNSRDFYVLTKQGGAILISETRETTNVCHIGQDYYKFSKDNLWGIVNAETGACISNAKYDSINHFGSELHTLSQDGKRVAFFDDRTGQIYVPK